MSILTKSLVSVVFFATLRCCYPASFTLVKNNAYRHDDDDDGEQNRRQWNESFIWPAPEYEVYEYMKSSDGTNLTRLLIDGEWDFVYNNTNTNNTTERWVIIMTAAKERFQSFLNQSVPTTTSKNLYRADDILTIRDDAMNMKTRTTTSNMLIPLEGIRFHISNLSETTLRHDLDESYEIQILNPLSSSYMENKGSGSIQNVSNYIEITSTNVFGALYGLETLKQLIQFIGFGDGGVPMFGILNNIYKLYIHDAPVYSYRGIMIDTARHFLPLQLIQQNLYIMLTNKLNVLHWHMSDTQSFPYASMKFPELAQHGAYCYPECTYNTVDIKMIIETAALLGIHVIVEIDLPTHSQGKQQKRRDVSIHFFLENSRFLIIFCSLLP